MSNGLPAATVLLPKNENDITDAIVERFWLSGIVPKVICLHDFEVGDPLEQLPHVVRRIKLHFRIGDEPEGIVTVANRHRRPHDLPTFRNVQFRNSDRDRDLGIAMRFRPAFEGLFLGRILRDEDDPEDVNSTRLKAIGHCLQMLDRLRSVQMSKSIDQIEGRIRLLGQPIVDHVGREDIRTQLLLRHSFSNEINHWLA